MFFYNAFFIVFSFFAIQMKMIVLYTFRLKSPKYHIMVLLFVKCRNETERLNNKFQKNCSVL